MSLPSESERELKPKIWVPKIIKALGSILITMMPPTWLRTVVPFVRAFCLPRSLSFSLYPHSTWPWVSLIQSKESHRLDLKEGNKVTPWLLRIQELRIWWIKGFCKSDFDTMGSWPYTPTWVFYPCMRGAPIYSWSNCSRCTLTNYSQVS